ncbi:jacalin-related lectin 3-like isoform X2 [Argentina anserina]|uniref:jacalin-related lectin 3-like isoform X2 n=1 Tax=Argentina anserina TaxID=57926 RepID=UPI0021764350|nr:jacalin-related lectin 3-like isoform X2 [Potentilla anserina]
MSLEESKNKPFSVGPFGSNGGDAIWDDGVHSTVRQVVIYADVKGIRWIQIEYDDNGSSVWSEKHGSDYPMLQTPKTYKVELDYPDEFFTSVYGYYTDSRFIPTHLTKLIFRSNRRSYGPFGVEDFLTRSFSIEASGQKIVGFHGRVHSWWLLRALGAYFMIIIGMETFATHQNIYFHLGILLLKPSRGKTEKLSKTYLIL